MNRIGESVQACSAFFKLDAAQIVAVHDDLELSFGQAAIKAGGGTAGHNGLRSIAKSIGSESFVRLRLGIGRPAHKCVVIHFQGFQKKK